MTLPEDTGPRWRRRPKDRPDEILAAAMDVFVRNGLAGARVEDIAEAAGVSKGTVYLYFKSKEDLFKEAVRTKVRHTREALSAAAAPGDPAQRLSGFMDAYWTHLCRPTFGPLYRLVLAELDQFPELSRFYSEEVSGGMLTITNEILDEGMAAGTFRRGDPGAASRMIIGLMVQHAVWVSRRELFPHLEGRSDAELLSSIKDFVFNALGRAGAGEAGDSA